MAMAGMTQELILELQSDETLANHPVVKMYLDGAKNVVNTNSDSDEVYESLLNNLEALSDFVGEKKNFIKNLVKDKKEKLFNTPKKKTKKLLGSIGLKDKVKKVKGSKASKDPIVKGSCDKIEEAIAVLPEFKSLVPFIRIFENYVYDADIKEVVTEAKVFLEENKPKLMIADTIFELERVNNLIYKNLCLVLEECLEKDETTSSAISMRLRDFKNVAVVNRLVNALKMYEAQGEGGFDMGIGSGATTVSDVISPFMKNENKSYFFVDSKMYVIKEDEEIEGEEEETDPDLISQEEYEGLPESFRKVCEAFYYLGFKEIEGKFVSTGTRHVKVSLKTNESGNVEVFIAGSKVEPENVNVTEIGMMESTNVRQNLADFFEGLSQIVNLQNVKRIRNTQFANESYAIGFKDKVFVMEKGTTTSDKFVKVSPVGFHIYVLEKFQYDVRDLYSIQLSEAEETAFIIDEEKRAIETDIAKLEQSEVKISEALKNPDITPDVLDHLTTLKESIQKSLVSLKNKYVALDLSKKN